VAVAVGVGTTSHGQFLKFIYVVGVIRDVDATYLFMLLSIFYKRRIVTSSSEVV